MRIVTVSDNLSGIRTALTRLLAQIPRMVTVNMMMRANETWCGTGDRLLAV